MPNLSIGQIALVIASAACFAAAMAASLLRVRSESRTARTAAKALGHVGLVFGVAALAWHSAERGTWLPLGDNFDTLVSLGLLLAGFVIYMHATRPLRGLDWFLLPIVVALLAGAVVFGRTKPHEYLDTTWSWAHRVTAYGGAVAFAVACAGGLMYLVANRRLRSKAAKRAGPGTSLGSLERLEHLTLVAVGLGFALLTIGLVTGLVRVARSPGETTLGDRWFLNPKVLLAAGVWVVYAVVLHSPINPSFRGRRAAVLSVVGFALMIGTLVAAQFVPSGK
jgi:ABC-type uncharacterized transport system permease subunit